MLGLELLLSMVHWVTLHADYSLNLIHHARLCVLSPFVFIDVLVRMGPWHLEILRHQVVTDLGS